MKEIVSKLHAVHSSRLQYETILTLWGGKPRREPIDTAHPLVRLLPLSFPFLSFLPHTLSHRSAPTPSPAFAHSTPTPASLCGSKSSRRRNRTLSSTSFTAISSTLPVRRSPCFSFSLTNRPVLLLFPALRSPPLSLSSSQIIKSAGAGLPTPSHSGTTGQASTASSPAATRRSASGLARLFSANGRTSIRRVRGGRSGGKGWRDSKPGRDRARSPSHPLMLEVEYADSVDCGSEEGD
jgi:hypothetical protein